MNRLESARIAAWKGQGRGGESGLGDISTMARPVASDAFFPFADGLLAAVEAGATAVDPAWRLDPGRGSNRRGRRGWAGDGLPPECATSATRALADPLSRLGIFRAVVAEQARGLPG
jgi:hypothetical protein